MMLGLQPGRRQMLNVTESPLDSFTVVQGRNAGAYIVSFAAYICGSSLPHCQSFRSSYPEVQDVNILSKDKL
jgi:hypothetical protein